MDFLIKNRARHKWNTKRDTDGKHEKNNGTEWEQSGDNGERPAPLTNKASECFKVLTNTKTFEWKPFLTNNY